MKVREIMSNQVVSVGPGETVAAAARQMERYGIGALPVMESDRLCGMITDRDLVVRCLAANRSPTDTKVREIMTDQVTTVDPGMDAGVAAHLMGRKKVRRLPVVEAGIVKGMLSLGDLATSEQNVYDAADALEEISADFPENKY